MIIKIDMEDGYTPVWNKMHDMFLPCSNNVAKLGLDYEMAVETFYEYAQNVHIANSVLSANIYMRYMDAMDAARAALKPFRDEWYRVRHGIGLN